MMQKITQALREHHIASGLLCTILLIIMLCYVDSSNGVVATIAKFFSAIFIVAIVITIVAALKKQ